MTPPAIASRTRMPRRQVIRGGHVLECACQESCNPEYERRQIVWLYFQSNGRWTIVNYE